MICRHLVPVAVATVAVAGMVVTPALAAPAAHQSKLRCSASASPSHPLQYSYVTINVKANKGQEKVKTTAHYKSTSTNKYARGNSHGAAHTSYYISDASIGFKVKVAVLVQVGHSQAKCSTAFTPR